MYGHERSDLLHACKLQISSASSPGHQCILARVYACVILARTVLCARLQQTSLLLVGSGQQPETAGLLGSRQQQMPPAG